MFVYLTKLQLQLITPSQALIIVSIIFLSGAPFTNMV